MLEVVEPDDATGAVGLAETALLTKALRPPRMKAARPAMMITRKLPRVRVWWLVLTAMDIFLLLSGIYGIDPLSVTDRANIS